MTATTTRAGDEREAFEAWARSEGLDESLALMIARRAWQARAALATATEQAGEPTLIQLLRDVCHYADSVCGMLRQGGWPGKAEALESRIKAVIDYDAVAHESNNAFETLAVALGYPWLPCLICRGTEGCDHTAPERARAALTATRQHEQADGRGNPRTLDRRPDAFAPGIREDENPRLRPRHHRRHGGEMTG